jgi:inorganic pyrophosphatase
LGVAFPFDFGFVPGTLGADGDPLDVLVLMDEPSFPGVVVPCRLVGVIEATQRPIGSPRGKRGTRNDRLVAVADKSHRHAGTHALRDLGDGMLAEIERFFVFYNAQKGVRFRPIGRADKAAARKLVDAGWRAARG